MRIFAVFIAAFMFMMGFDVCVADNLCGQTEKVQHSQASGNSQEPDNSCSPFCHCSRCLFSALLPGGTEYRVPNALPFLSAVLLSGFFLEGVNSSIWQPPRHAHVIQYVI